MVICGFNGNKAKDITATDIFCIRKVLNSSQFFFLINNIDVFNPANPNDLELINTIIFSYSLANLLTDVNL